MKKFSRVLLFFVTSFYFTTSFAMSVDDETRYTALIQEIRCVVCQNQNIADSNAPLANDLRKKIYAMVENNQSDEDIKNYLVARYGEFILLKPRFHGATLFLWLFPFTCLVAAVLLQILRRNRINKHGHPTLET